MTTKKVKTDQPAPVEKGEQRQATLAECNALMFAKPAPAATESEAPTDTATE